MRLKRISLIFPLVLMLASPVEASKFASEIEFSSDAARDGSRTNILEGGLADGNIFVGDGNGDPASVTLSGDGSLDNTGAITITAIDGTAASTWFKSNILGVADEASFKAAVNLEAGTDFNAYSAGLQSLGGLTTSANQMVYTTGSDTYAVTGLTSEARSVLDGATLTELNALVSDATLLATDGDGSSLTGLLWSQIGSTPTTLSGYGITQIVDTDTTPPATATSTGTAGQIIADNNYLYICVATDTWRRVAIASW